MATTNSVAHATSSVTAILDIFMLKWVGEQPTIQSIKALMLELCNMAEAVESTNSGGKFGHMYLILKEDEYRIATGIPMAPVIEHTKPGNVNPKFKTEIKEDLTSFCIRQLEAKTRAMLLLYTTQEEVAKELVCRMVDSIDQMYI